MLVDDLEGLLEPLAGGAVDLADRLLEGVQRVRKVGELAVEVLLALGLFGELVDRREVDVALELVDLGEILVERRLRRVAAEALVESVAGLVVAGVVGDPGETAERCRPAPRSSRPRPP